MKQETLNSLIEMMPDEIVTVPKLNIVTLPASGQNFALITLASDKDHSHLNTLGPKSFSLLNQLLSHIEKKIANKQIIGLGIVGKPYIFSAGADLSVAKKITNREQGLLIADMGHSTFNRIANLDIPTFSFINGMILGGGLELSLSTKYRTISSSVTKVGLPETYLGLIPGWGGCYRLPNLIGCEAAIKVIIENPQAQNRTLKAEQAYSLGIADAIFDSANFLEASLLWAEEVIFDKVQVSRIFIDRSENWDKCVAGAEKLLDRKLHHKFLAPYKALELIKDAKHGSPEAIYDAESQVIADLLISDELQLSLYGLFNILGKHNKKLTKIVEEPKKIRKIGIVGAGLMASQLALIFMRKLQVPVVISDIDENRISQAIYYTHREIDKLVDSGKLSVIKADRIKNLISGRADFADFSDTDFVIEAIFEEMSVKQEVLQKLEDVISPTAILASNTSSLSVTEMAKNLRYPNRVIGFHFFNPVAVMPLVEVIHTANSDSATIEYGTYLAKKLHKTPILSKDSAGFIVNRLLIRALSDVIKSFDQGTDLRVVEQVLVNIGFPMSAFSLLSLVGMPVAQHASETLEKTFGDRFYVSENINKAIAAKLGHIVEYNSSGIFGLAEGVAEIFEYGNSPQNLSELQETIESNLAEEINFMLNEKVVSEVSDIDLALILGAGFPLRLGGITPYLDKKGISQKVVGKKFRI